METEGIFSDLMRIESICVSLKKVDGVEQGISCRLIEEDPCRPLLRERNDALQGSPLAISDHRLSTGLGLNRCDSKILPPRKDESSAATIIVPYFFIPLPSQEFDILFGPLSQRLLFLTVPHNQKRSPQPIKGVDGKIDPFVRSKSGDHQEIVARFLGRWGGLEEIAIHWRIDHGRLSSVEFSDPLLDMPRIGDEMVNPLA